MYDSFKTKKTLKIGKKTYTYFSFKAAEKNGLKNISSLPFSIKVLLENLIRNEDGTTVSVDDIKDFDNWKTNKKINREINFRPARVLMQDFTGVPAVVDLASMRSAIMSEKGDPKKVNPLSPVDLVIDHSVMVDKYGSATSYKANVDLEYKRNIERYEFLRWGQKSFNNFRVVPPGTGICHQVNLEYLAKTVWSEKKKIKNRNLNLAYPDTVVGTDSHTTMINGLSVLGWGVGGIEAEAAMLGQPISMVVPEVIGFEIKGKIKEGITATDLVLTITEQLRQKGVVGKFVEFYGAGLKELSVPDRATISNMAPEYGATCGFFPIDEETIKFLKVSGRSSEEIKLVEKYAKAQDLWEDYKKSKRVYTETMQLDLSSIEPSLAGPKRPQDKILLSNVSDTFIKSFEKEFGQKHIDNPIHVKDEKFQIDNGHVAIAAITSCTNTSNPSVMIGAGILAQKAIKMGLKSKPWVKTSLAPGSKVVTDYLMKSGLQEYLDKLGFNLVGFGCTTCIGNSGPLDENISDAITKNDLIVSGVLSGNRNFEGRINPFVKANYLASPPLVVAYALAGSTKINLTKDPLGYGKNNQPVYLKDIWPKSKEIKMVMNKIINSNLYKQRYKNVFKGDKKWNTVKSPSGLTYKWNKKSTYVQHPPFFKNSELNSISDIKGANILGIFGDSVTTDHISPAGAIKEDSPAGDYLKSKKIKKIDFNSFGARRGNHEIMMRGTFANIRIKNEMLDNIEGGYTIHYPSKKQMSIYDASIKYNKSKTPLVVIAGKDYGMGSSRDWAAKGTNLLGVKAVIAESYERIHRSNLIGMGVLPFIFKNGENRKSLKLEGPEKITISGIKGNLKPQSFYNAMIVYKNGKNITTEIKLLVNTSTEVEYLNSGGILQYVLKELVNS